MALLEAGQTLLNGLPPYGGSGLKSVLAGLLVAVTPVSLHTEGVD